MMHSGFVGEFYSHLFYIGLAAVPLLHGILGKDVYKTGGTPAAPFSYCFIAYCVRCIVADHA